MSFSRIKRRAVHFFSAIWLWALGVLGLVALGWFFYFLTTLGPSRVANATPQVKGTDSPAMLALSGEIGDVEQQYQKAADANLVTPDLIDQLAQALEKERKLVNTYLNAGQAESDRLVRLDAELGSARAKQQLSRIDQLEQDGQTALTAKNPTLAAAKFAEELKLQHDINASSADSGYKNLAREVSLSQRIAALAAAPQLKQVQDLIAAAHQAEDGRRWTEALDLFTKARDAQQAINQQYGGTNFVYTTVVTTLNAEIQSLNAADTATEIDAKEKQGDDAVAAGKPLEAATYFEAAGALQQRINTDFPMCRFVSSERVQNLEIKRQTALSTKDADALAALDADITRSLRKRQIVLATTKIAEADALVGKLFTTYPLSRRLDTGLKLKLDYLDLRQADLRATQDKVYASLLPLPGNSWLLMLKTEVPQALYAGVLNSNPSRNLGDALPVDSVSWDDANTFCTQLGWILGLPIRLPTVAEYQAALGLGQATAWNRETSDGHSQPVGTGSANGFGFYDLLGNLAEWTSTQADGNSALVFGGSYLDEAATLQKQPTETRLKSDRARFIGFRVIVMQPPSQ